MAAQSIVLQGTWWQVGNGHSIEICGDNWLHKISTFRLTSQPIVVPSNDKVSVKARPRLEKIVRPSFDHLPWRRSHVREAHWRPLLIIGVVRAELQVLSLSLSGEEGICLPLEVWHESSPNFGCEVVTNHWVFLRCDWSLISS